MTALTHTRRLQLASGGVVSLTVTGDPFAWSSVDRHLVFELLDRLSEYVEHGGSAVVPEVLAESVECAMALSSEPEIADTSDAQAIAHVEQAIESLSPGAGARAAEAQQSKQRKPHRQRQCRYCQSTEHGARKCNATIEHRQTGADSCSCGEVWPCEAMQRARAVAAAAMAEPPPMPALDPWHDPAARAARERELAAAAKRELDEKLAKDAARAKQRMAGGRAARTNGAH